MKTRTTLPRSRIRNPNIKSAKSVKYEETQRYKELDRTMRRNKAVVGPL
jgi:hypothetical protein